MTRIVPTEAETRTEIMNSRLFEAKSARSVYEITHPVYETPAPKENEVSELISRFIIVDTENAQFFGPFPTREIAVNRAVELAAEVFESGPVDPKTRKFVEAVLEESGLTISELIGLK